MIEKSQRLSNFELLRIICMLFVICGHLMMEHGYEKLGDTSWYINQILRPFCMVAVNVFVLISGYFSIKLNYKKLLSTNWMVTFYSVLFLILTIYLGTHDFLIRKDWMQLFPVLTKQYWFITVYFVLCLISPYLNLLADKLRKKIFENMLIVLFFVFCVVPTLGYVLNFQSVTGDAGYGIVSFSFLYLLGRYFRLYLNKNSKNNYYIVGYFLSMLLCVTFQIIFSKMLGFSFDALISYDTLYVFVGSVCLFLSFCKLKLSNKFVNNMAKNCLAVYVIHFHLFSMHICSTIYCC